MGTDNVEDCFYCGVARNRWNEGCKGREDRLHWTAAERIGLLEREHNEHLAMLRLVHGLILAGATAMRALEVCGRRAGKRARREVPRRPDSLELETEAAKISDTFAVMHNDPSLSTGPTFDRLEGR
jgi:hypothetical protein